MLDVIYDNKLSDAINRVPIVYIILQIVIVVFEIFSERNRPMKRYILTGTPGSGKTSILHELGSRGYAVIEEAATDVIAIEHKSGNAEPWMQADFIDKIVRLQKQRQLEAVTAL